MLITQQCFACSYKELSNCQIYLSLLATKYNTLEVNKRPWGNAANPKWLRIYSTPFGIVLTSKIWEKGEERHSIQRYGIYLPKLHVLRPCFPRHGWASDHWQEVMDEFLFLLWLHVQHLLFLFICHSLGSWDFPPLFHFSISQEKGVRKRLG